MSCSKKPKHKKWQERKSCDYSKET